MLPGLKVPIGHELGTFAPTTKRPARASFEAETIGGVRCACVVGSGVIGTIYGSTLTRAGTDVVHFVLPDADTPLARGATVRLLDGRHEPPDEYDLVYRPKLVTDLADAGPVDLVFASVRHYQVAGLLPTLRGVPGAPDIMFFNNYWQTLEGIDAELARERYLWGFPVAGGGWAGDRLEAALLGEVRLGELDGTRTARANGSQRCSNVPGSRSICKQTCSAGSGRTSRSRRA